MEILLPPDLLANSPSRIDGITDDDELRHRSFGAELIQEANILLKLPQVVAITAQNIFHRFYYRKSLKKFDAFTVAQGCCLLASKIEEVPKMLREVKRGMHISLLLLPYETLSSRSNNYSSRFFAFFIISTNYVSV